MVIVYLSLLFHVFSRDSDLRNSSWDVDILKSGCGYTRLGCGYTQKDVDILCYQVVFKDVDIL